MSEQSLPGAGTPAPVRTYDRLEALETRVTRLEDEMREVKILLTDKIMPMLIRIDERSNAMSSQSATKIELATLKGEILAQLAEKPGKAYLWTVLAVLVGAIMAAIAAGVSIAVLIPR